MEKKFEKNDYTDIESDVDSSDIDNTVSSCSTDSDCSFVSSISEDNNEINSFFTLNNNSKKSKYIEIEFIIIL